MRGMRFFISVVRQCKTCRVCNPFPLLSCGVIALFLLLNTHPCLARPTTAEQAEQVTGAWLSTSRSHLNTRMATTIFHVRSFFNDRGRILYHVVSLLPDGFVIIAGDDLVEPVVAFVPQGRYSPDKTNPLGALVTSDMTDRIQRADEALFSGFTGRINEVAGQRDVRAKEKWDQLLTPAEPQLVTTAAPLFSDPRVDPFVLSRWSQDYEGDGLCYNYYTPNHYPSGCVATAMAQLMRFHSHPVDAVGNGSYTISVDQQPQTAQLRGGDGIGGSYIWPEMVLDPDSSITVPQRQAIGALMYDSGLSVGMSYTVMGSGTDALKAADAFVNTFGYANAVKGYNSNYDLPATIRNHMVNPNLDAGLPVLLGINGPDGGHAVVCDGYGYDGNTLYHHLNLGWLLIPEGWYNLPIIEERYTFDKVYKCVYNIYVDGAGEIISGRILDNDGVPVSGAVVRATTPGGEIFESTSNDRGIYALAKLPDGISLSLNAEAGELYFPSLEIILRSSLSGTTQTGNLWGVDFHALEQQQTTGTVFPWILFRSIIGK